ncbi:MAG TPA: hypothetical protein VF632_04505 [Longimicrobium sp.]|jgi:hypothetical protein
MCCEEFADDQEWEDPIVKEIHETRERLAARFGYDVPALFAHIREREADSGKRGVVFADPSGQPRRSPRDSRAPDAA